MEHSPPSHPWISPVVILPSSTASPHVVQQVVVQRHSRFHFRAIARLSLRAHYRRLERTLENSSKGSVPEGVDG